MMQFVCIKCKDRAKGCTFIAEDGNRLPLVCVRKEDRIAVTCEWLEVPDKKTSMDFSY